MKLTDEQVARIKRLETTDGTVTPTRVVDDARADDSPLHDLFEWDDDKAAEAYRLQQARDVIGAVHILVKSETFTYRAPAYVRDPDAEAKAQGYRSVVALAKDPDAARESLIYTLNIAAGHLRRAFDIAQPLGLHAEIDGLLEQVAGVQRSIETAA